MLYKICKNPYKNPQCTNEHSNRFDLINFFFNTFVNLFRWINWYFVFWIACFGLPLESSVPQQMNEFTNMYSYLKVISETTTDQAASECPFSAKRFILYIYIYFNENWKIWKKNEFNIINLNCCSIAWW